MRAGPSGEERFVAHWSSGGKFRPHQERVQSQRNVGGIHRAVGVQIASKPGLAGQPLTIWRLPVAQQVPQPKQQRARRD